MDPGRLEPVRALAALEHDFAHAQRDDGYPAKDPSRWSTSPDDLSTPAAASASSAKRVRRISEIPDKRATIAGDGTESEERPENLSDREPGESLGPDRRHNGHALAGTIAQPRQPPANGLDVYLERVHVRSRSRSRSGVGFVENGADLGRVPSDAYVFQEMIA